MTAPTTSRLTLCLLLASAVATLAACNDKASTDAPPRATITTPTAPAHTAAATASPTPEPPGQPAKSYDCGAKDQKPCPMQGWMKRVMAPASASDDAEALAKALTYVAAHAPPGFTEWSPMASAAAAKAKAGDSDGAKASCKQCHDLYKDKYKASMRDRAF